MEQLMVFRYGEHELHVVLKHGEIWLSILDICSILQIESASIAVGGLPAKMKGICNTSSLGGTQCLSVLSEAGVYQLALAHWRPETEKFIGWLMKEALPSMHRYIASISTEWDADHPELLSRLAKAIRYERQKRNALEQQVILLQSKAAFADAVSNSKDAIPVGDMAKLICQSGYYIGRNAFFAYLRENGWLIRQNCDSWNLPTQKGMERRFFIIVETFRKDRKAEVLHRTPMVTGRGQVYFLGQFMKKMAYSLSPEKAGGGNPCLG